MLGCHHLRSFATFRFGTKNRPAPGLGVLFTQIDRYILDNIVQTFVKKNIENAYVRKKKKKKSIKMAKRFFLS